MNKKSLRASVTGLFAVTLFVAGCTVDLDTPPGTNNVFPCDTDSQCTTVNGNDYECRLVADVGNVCVRESTPNPVTCEDADDDGWGVEDGPQTSTSVCRACEEGEYRGCDVDCGPQDDGVYPGHYDPCDGTDSDCDSDTDDYLQCEGPEAPEEAELLYPDRRDVFCQEYIAGSETSNKSSTNPEGTEFECAQLNSGDENRYCVPVSTDSGGQGCGSIYVCNGGDWECAQN